MSKKTLFILTLIFWVAGFISAYFGTGGFSTGLPSPTLFVLGGLLALVGILTFFMGIVAMFKKNPPRSNNQVK